jgi:hypothetical protein
LFFIIRQSYQKAKKQNVSVRQKHLKKENIFFAISTLITQVHDDFSIPVLYEPVPKKAIFVKKKRLGMYNKPIQDFLP